MLNQRVVVPIVLGCCPREPRCALCPPSPPPPNPETIRALVGHYERERARDGQDLVVGFYGGPPPPDPLIDAIDGRPFQVRVRPDLLSRAEAERIVARGVVGIELDALTLSDRALGATGRAYRAALVLEMLRSLRAYGVRLGAVLAPGLPRLDPEDATRDASAIAALVDVARLHPVLVLEGSRLQEMHEAGFYRPLELVRAVEICAEMMDVLESCGVAVIRVGVQPGPDGLGRAVAGPQHPSFRELVESGRTLERLGALCQGVPFGARIRVRCAPGDEARARGPENRHLRDLRDRFGLHSVRIETDPALERGMLRVEADGETD